MLVNKPAQSQISLEMSHNDNLFITTLLAGPSESGGKAPGKVKVDLGVE